MIITSKDYARAGQVRPVRRQISFEAAALPCRLWQDTIKIFEKKGCGVQFLYNFIYFFHMPVFVFIIGFPYKTSGRWRRTHIHG